MQRWPFIPIHGTPVTFFGRHSIMLGQYDQPGNRPVIAMCSCGWVADHPTYGEELSTSYGRDHLASHKEQQSC